MKQKNLNKIHCCIICKNDFKVNAPNQKTCSKVCFVEHRKRRKRKTDKLKEKNFICRFCNNSFKRYRKRNGFCSRSCASKFYIKNGTYDKWNKAGIKLNKKKAKSLIEKQCVTCKKNYFIKQKEHKRKRSKTCSIKCRRKYVSKINSGAANHFYGKKFKKIWEEKRRETLQKRYGINNAYALSKRKTISRGQLELYNLLKKNLNKSAKTEILLEKLTIKNPKNIYVDILIPKEKIAIEYNGDFWHCNPEKYSKEYYNPKKRMCAKDIWQQDKTRKQILEQNGYKVFIVWENDFKKDKENIGNKLLRKIRGKYD